MAKFETPRSGRSSGIQMAEAQHIGYGQQRKTLEDRCKAISLKTAGGLDLTIGIVADGIGGASAGETAGQLAVDSVIQYIQASRDQNIPLILRNALLTAHNAIRSSAASNINLRTMGTTATLAAIHQGHLYLAHVGDSRAYLVREDKIQQLTLDHTWGNEKLKSGQFRQEEIYHHPRRDELVRYVGAPVSLEVDTGLRLDDLNPPTSTLYPEGYPLKAGDTILLCTDGLIKNRRGGAGHYTETEEIINVIQRNTPQDTANTLVSLALGRQVDDNVSVVVLEMPGKKKKIGAPSGINPILVAAGLLILTVFLLIGIFIPILLARPTPIPATPTRETLAQSLTPTEQAGYVFITLENNGTGKYLVPGEEPKPLPNGDYAPIEANTRINVVSGVAKLNIPGGTTIYIGENTIVYFNQIPQPENGQKDTILTLERGSILTWVHVGKVVVKTQPGYSAEVSGSVMGVQNIDGKFNVDCFEGHCTILDSKQQILSDMTGPLFNVVEDGVVTQPDDMERLRFWSAMIGEQDFTQFGLFGTPTPEATKTPLPPTPDIQATSECERLLGLGTPCPPAP